MYCREEKDKYGNNILGYMASIIHTQSYIEMSRLTICYEILKGHMLTSLIQFRTYVIWV